MDAQQPTEFTLLKKGSIRITNQRAIFGTKVYSIANILSARTSANEPRLFVVVFFLLMSAVCLSLYALANMSDYAHYLGIGLYLAIGAVILLLVSRVTKYSVQVRSRVGEVRIYESNNRDIIDQIVEAINTATTLNLYE